MKKIAASLLVALSFTGLVFACGGMTQIDPPSLQLDAGSSDLDVHSVRNEVQGVVCLV
jgi:hypothetical protein|tara:strand:- start:440 stop:613 length:174 start_codon:yes stop_codon:yes gene_type:complete